jgi:parvulin-like peptidyl-prolyl isomerase
MSASREKQNRQAQPGQAGPKTAREAQQRKEQKRSNLLYGLIAAAFLIVVILSAVWRTNLIPKMAPAASIDGQNYNAGEISYYYQSAYRNFVNNYSYFVSYLGLDTSLPLKGQEISQETALMLGIDTGDAGEETPAGNEDAAAPAEGEDGETPAEDEDAAAPEDTGTGMTWHEYFLDQALNNMATIQAGLKAAEAEGYAFSDSIQAQHDETMDSLRSAAAASGVSVSQYLSASFGGGITEKIYSDQLLRTLRYSDYSTAYVNSLQYSDSDLKAVYDGDPNTYDHVSYETVSFSGAAESTTDEDGNTVEPTEEESAAALDAANEKAAAVVAAIQEGGNPETLADEHEGTYNKTESGSYTAGSALSEWLYNPAREPGEAAVVTDGTNLYAVVFHERFRDEYDTVNVRHILIGKGTATLSEEDEGYAEEQEKLTADAHAKAEEVLAQWQSGEATEDSFAALALTESTDPGSRFNGGLYQRVYEGQMVETFNDWCFDASRKSGDTGLVDTDYGTHVMYYVGTDLPRWQAQTAQVLENEDYTEWETALTANTNIERHDFGMKFVG